MAVGDILLQGDLSAYIETIDLDAGQVTIDYEQAWTTGAATVEVLKGIDCQIEWTTEGAGNPAGFKQFFETIFLFQQRPVKQATVYFYSDNNPGESSIDLNLEAGNGAWGDFLWGEVPFGGDQTETTRRLGVPRTHARCSNLSVRFTSRAAFNDFRLSGISLVFNPTSTRVTR
jgi:hypothetical protein